MGVPNVLVSIGYAPNDEALKLHSIKPKYFAERKFYSCRQNNDILKYINSGIDEGDFLGYAGNREKSSGLFGENGLLTKTAIKDLRSMLRTTDSNIWHAVISFTEEFGGKYMTSYKDAMELLKAELPAFFKSIGVAADNVVWYAGLHENTDNQHIHLGFFEKEPRFTGENCKVKRYRFGTIGQDALNSLRIKIEERLTDAGFDLKRSRRNLTDSARDTLFHLQGLNDYERELKRKLLALYRALPIDGRVSYGSKNMDALRPQVNEIVNFIIKNNPNLKRDFDAFCSDLARFDANRKRICEDQKIADSSKYLVSDKYLTDIYRRLGDKVIKAALNIKQKGDREAKKCKTDLAKKRADKRHRGYLLERALRIGADVDAEASVAAVTEQLTSNIERHNRRMQTGFLGTAIILPALTKIGRSDLAYMLLFQDENPSWLYSVMQGATTTWERWDSYTIEDGFGDAGMNSFNHYAYGAVAGWMFSSMAGIGYDPSAPGFANILFAPRPNEKMKSVEASYESAYGTVTAKSCFEGDRWNYTVTVPANATATVKLPVPSLEGITVNGKKAASLSAADGVAAALLRDGYAVFEVTAGTFSFSVDSSALYRG